MKCNVKSVLDTTKGYVVLPRLLVEKMVDNMNIDSENNLYCYLLVTARYAQSVSEGIVWKRGEISFSIKELAQMTGKGYFSIFRLMQRLEEINLVSCRTVDGHRHLFLPYYEEHCGHKVRQAEQMEKAEEAKNQVDKRFALFWEFYHLQVPVPQVDCVAARKAYGRLSLTEQTLAIKNVERYYASLTSDKQAKWAVNYLKDKSFIFQVTTPGNK